MPTVNNIAKIMKKKNMKIIRKLNLKAKLNKLELWIEDNGLELILFFILIVLSILSVSVARLALNQKEIILALPRWR